MNVPYPSGRLLGKAWDGKWEDGDEKILVLLGDATGDLESVKLQE